MAAAALAVISCTDVVAPVKQKSSLAASLGLRTRVIYVGAPNSQPVNYIRVRVYGQADNAQLGALEQYLDSTKDNFDFSLPIELPGGLEATTRLTLELVSKTNSNEVVQYSGRVLNLALEPREYRQVEIDIYPGPLDNFDVKKISINKPIPDRIEGDSVQAKVTLEGTAKSPRVNWTSLDASIAKIDQSTGMIHALLPGTVRIVGGAGPLADTAPVVVHARRAGVLVSPDTVTLQYIGDVATFTAKVVDARGAEISGEQVKWSVDSPAVATPGVSAGQFIAVRAGTAKVTAKSASDSTLLGTGVIRVTGWGMATIELQPLDTTLTSLGDTVVYRVVGKDATGKVMTGLPWDWSSSTTTVAQMKNGGIATAMAEGKSSIRVGVAAENKWATASFNVVQAVGSVVIVTPPADTATNGAALPVQPVVEIRDARGNPIKRAGVTITVTVSGGSIQNGVVQTDSTGRATFTGLVLRGTAGPKVLSFSAPSTSPTVASVNLRAGSMAGLVVVRGDSQTTTVNTPVATAPAVRLLDADNNGVGGKSVTFSIVSGDGKLTGSAAVTTDSTGLAQLGGWTLGTKAGKNELSATSGSLSSAVITATGVPGAPSKTKSIITVSSAKLTAGDTTKVVVTVQLADEFGNLLTRSGGTVALTTTGGALSSVIDNGNGTYTAKLTPPSTADIVTIAAAIGSDPLSSTTQVAIVAGSASLDQSLVAASPTSITADGTSKSTITVQLKDASGNNLTASGGTLTLATSQGGTLSSVTDNGNGTYTATLTSPTAVGSTTITALLGGQPLTHTVNVTFTPGAAAVLVLTGSSSQTAGTAQSVTITAKDANGNVATGYTGDKTLIFSGASAAGSGANPTASDKGSVATNFASSTTVTFSNGVATTSMVLYKVETASVATSDGSLTAANGNRLIVNVSAAAPSAAQTTLSVGSSTLSANGTTTLTITVKDAFGNVITGASASDFTLTTDVGSIGSVSCSNGVCTATYTAPASSGTATVTAKIGGTNVSGSPATISVASVAGAPSGLAATAGNAQVELTWTAPSNNGGSAITDYLVEYSSDGGTTWSAFAHSASTATSITVTSLTNGTTYTFRVSAVNTNGTGASSSPTTATPVTVPAAPTGLSATNNQNQQVPLSWTAPSSNGGAAISDYKVEYSANGGTSWSTFSHTASTATNITVTGLTNGTSYTFRVSAVNTVGTGAASSTATAIPATVPNAPTALAATSNQDQQVPLSWTAPSNDGGAAITDYKVEYSADNGGTWLTFSHTASTAASIAVTGLTNGTTYTFRVSAITGNGTGTTSSTATATPATVPGAPTGLSGTSGQNGQVPLNWSAPGSNGGSSITDYEVEYSSNGGTSWSTFSHTASTSTSITVTGLTNGTTYTFRVSAVNAVGTGSASSAATATPSASPTGPTALSATSYQNQQVPLSWSAPSNDGGSAITDYLVEYSSNGGTSWSTFSHTASTSTSITVTGLTNGTGYTFRVSAVNANGTGAASSSATATPATTAGAPTGLSATSNQNGQVPLSWSAPGSNGGASITDYLVEFSGNGGTSWSSFSHTASTSTSITVTGLTNGTTYTFRVSAVNGAGTGSASSTATGTPATVPGAPTALSATSNQDGQVPLSWNAPGSNGGASITDYLVEYSANGGTNWSTFSHTASTSTSITVTGLTNGTTYTFRVSAVNAAGTGSASSTTTGTPMTVPSAPTGLGATAGNAEVALAWTAPGNGGSAITDYLVEYSSDNGSTWATFSHTASTSTSITVTSLTNGTTYKFRVSAVNAVGTGAASSTVTATPAATAGAPTGLSATSNQSGQVPLSWSAPGSSGGSSITDYKVEYSDDNGGSWSVFNHTASTSTTITVTGLTNGTTYTFRVSAINGVGTGTASSTATGTPATVPGAPTSLSATSNQNGQVPLSWSAPGSNGGASITDYLVEYSANGGTSWSTFSHSVSNATSITVTSLSNGTTYTFRISAINAAGTGSASSTTTGTPTTVPGAPTALGATAGNQQVDLTWSAPSNNGGRAITDYLVEYSSNGGTTWSTFSHTASTATSITVTSLTNGTPYTFRVSAINANGTGSASSTASATPAGLPNAPTGLSATSYQSGQVPLSWSAPSSDGGSAITDYTIEYSSNGGTSWSTFSHSASTATSITVTGLTNGTTYTFRVSAVNANGSGTLSSTTTGTPATVPGAPTGLSATSNQNGQVPLSWSAPGSNGGVSISDYTIEYSSNGGSTWASFTHTASSSTSITVTGLTNGTTYTFRVSAVNGAGTGSASTTTTGTPATVPGAPTSLSATSNQDGQVPLSWSAPGSNGGASISDYLVEYSANGGTSWSTFAHTASTSTSITVTSLTNGTTYTFRVSAVNAAGTGSASSTATATPAAVPGAPTGLSATSYQNQQVPLSWSAPGSSGGSAITDYKVEYSSDGGTNWNVFSHTASNATSITVTSLTNGTTYTFRVSAINGVGTGSASSTTTGMPATVAGAPTGLSATSNQNGQVPLSWSAPASDGGASITDYTVEYSANGGSTWSTFSHTASTSTSITVTGLTNGTTYTFRISAVNAAGTGSTSSTTTGKPAAVPGAPTALGATAGNTQVDLSWTAPSNTGGLAITDYLVEYSSNGGTSWTTFSHTASTSTSITVTGLTNGTSYTFRVSAVNANGTGTASSTTTATPATVPGAPTSLSATSNQSGQVPLSWSAPGSNGGASISDYTIEYSSNGGSTWSTFSHTASNATSITVTGLTNGTTYTFRVSAVNGSGTGSASSTTTGTPATVPGAPTSLSATSNQDGQVPLSWSAPGSNGGASISDYLVEYSANGGTNWSTFSHTASTSTSITVTSLTNGTTYTFRVSAINGAGTGSASSSTTGTPSGTPGAPTGLSATSNQSGQVPLSWSAPSNDGGSSITNYLVEYSADGGTNWSTFAHSASTSTSITVTGLTNGTTYTFRVSAINTNGTGTASNTTTGTPATTPGTPTGLSGTSYQSQQVPLSWTAPSNGGSAITNYLVEYSSDGGTNWNTFSHTASASTSITVTGLTNGTTYTFRVSAVNANGTGSASSTATATPATVPSAPTGLSATSNQNGQVPLSWSAPGSNGGASIADYLIEYSSNGGTSWSTFSHTASTSTSITVTGLTNGTTYTFRVSAVNGAGTGSASTTTTGTPATVPGAPTGLSATSNQNGQVPLSWSAPGSNGGTSITDYTIEYSSNGGSTWSTFSHTASTSTSITVTSLTNGTTYTFRVSAVNGAGTGSASSTTTGTPATTPGAPTALGATAGNAQVSLSWTAPGSNGGASITDYLVEYSSNGGSTWSTFSHSASTATNITVTSLTNGTTYTFRVSAINAVGTGSASSTASATPSGVPGTPTGLSATSYQSQQVPLSWTAPSNGGSAITDYLVEYSANGGTNWSTFSHTASTSTSITVTGLTNGTTYTFRVSAINAAGTGSPSSTTTGIPATLPGAPTGLGATSNQNTQVPLSWTAPGSNGGSAITDYTIEYSSNGGSTWSTFSHTASTSTSITVTGLTNGTTYTFRVSAVNAAGTGSASSTTTGTPATTPGVPTSVSATAGNAQVSLTWTAPSSNGGSAITDYTVQYSATGAAPWTTFSHAASTSTSQTVTGLTNGTTYTFQVAAVNAVGTGSYSSTTTATPGVPGAPTGLTVTLNQNTSTSWTAALSWTAPTNTGGSAISDYKVEYSSDNGSSWNIFADGTSTATTASVTGLANLTTYLFRVSAINSIGTGSPSSTATATTLGPSTRLQCTTPGGANSSVSTTSITGCSGVAVGNMIVIPITIGDSADAVTGPAGFTKLNNTDYSYNSGLQTTIFYKIADASDVALPTYTFTWANKKKVAITLVVYKNVSSIVASAVGNGATAPASSPAITVAGTSPHTLLYLWTGVGSLGTTSPTVSLWTVSSSLFKNTTAGSNTAGSTALLTTDVDKATGGTFAAGLTATFTALSNWISIVLSVQ